MIIDRYSPGQILKMEPHHTLQFIQGLGMRLEVAGLVMIRSPPDGKPYPDARYVNIDTLALYLEELKLWPEVNQRILDRLYGHDLIGEPIELSDHQAIELELLKREGYHPFRRQFVRGKSKLMEAVCEGKADVVRRLIYVKTDINYATFYNNTALIFAAMGNRADIINILLEAGADADVVNAQGLTAFDMARQLGHTEAMEALQATQLLSEFSAMTV